MREGVWVLTREGNWGLRKGRSMKREILIGCSIRVPGKGKRMKGTGG
jgi:hypothetical protein